MKTKKLLSTMLAMTVGVSTLSAVTISANAESPKKTINMGGSVIVKDDNIYYGNAKKFRVLSTDGNTTQNGTTTETATYTDDEGKDILGPLFVISENGFSNMRFDDSSNAWKGSEAQIWCNGTDDGQFYKTAGITDTEKAAILTTSKSDEEYWFKGTYEDTYFKATDSDDLKINDKVFYLSANEVETYFDGKEDRKFKPDDGTDVARWRLRSSLDDRGHDIYLGVIDGDGNLDYYLVTYTKVPPRPAFNLNLSSVLFTSAAENGKTATTLTDIADYNGTDWKFTLKSDDYKDFVLGEATKDDTNITINFTGAILDDNHWVSAIVEDTDGNIKSYAHLTNDSNATSVTVPVSAIGETDSLYLFNEELNGDKKTDYAGELQEVTISAHTHSTDADAVTFDTKIETLDQLKTLFADGGSGYLNTEIITDEVLTVPADKTVDLCLNGKALDLNKKNIVVNGKLNVYDCDDTNVYNGHFDKLGIWRYDREEYTLQEGETEYQITGGMITNGKGNHGGAFCVESTGELTLNDISVCGCAVERSGGCIFNNGIVTMNGGLICGNRSDSYGGGINCYNYSTCTINNSSIIYNSSLSLWGGGVHCGNNSTFTMNDTIITGNKAVGYGGGVFASQTSTVNVGGASVIRGNYTDIDDSNIHLQNNSTTVLKLSDTNPLKDGADVGVTLWSSSGWNTGTVVDSYFGGTLNDDNYNYIVLNNSGDCNKGTVYNIGKDVENSKYVLNGDYEVSNAELPDGVKVTDGVQSVKNDDNTADMRFLWNIHFNGNEAPSKLGAYFLVWEQFDFDKPFDEYTKIENNNVDETLTDGGLFYATIKGIKNMSQKYYAIPIVNDNVMPLNILSGNVNDTNINEE